MAEAKKAAASASASTSSPPLESCRKKKTEGATLAQDVLDHIDEFVHASVDDHKNCFRKSLSKMFELTKAAGQPAAPVESVLPLTVTTTD